MQTIRGVFRLTVSFLAIAISTLLILLLAWVPVRIRGLRLASWLVYGLANFLAFLFTVRFTCTDAERLRQHSGFIFPNHLSFVDIVLLLTVWPVRFVSMAELRSWPFIGWMAMAADTVFVDRSDKTSRNVARQQLAKQVSRHPAVVLFPEGGISSSGELQPFRYGAFEIAVEGSLPFIPCVFVYERLDVVGWTDEPLLTALWRLSRFGDPLVATLHVLRIVQPVPGDDPKRLALETHGAMNAVLTYAGRENDVLKPEF